MKKILPLAGSTIATLGICLMAISCGEKNDTDTSTGTSPKENADASEAPAKTAPPEEEAAPAPTGDLESQAVGYWAPDAETMMGFLAEDLKDEPERLAAMKAMMEPMLAAMAVHIPEKGKVVLHMMGDTEDISYIVKSVDEASKTLTVEIDDEPGTITIGEDSLVLAGGDDRIALTRIDEAAFKKRQEAKAPNILDLPEGPGPDGSEDEPVAEELPTEEAAPAAPAEAAPGAAAGGPAKPED